MFCSHVNLLCSSGSPLSLLFAVFLAIVVFDIGCTDMGPYDNDTVLEETDYIIEEAENTIEETRSVTEETPSNKEGKHLEYAMLYKEVLIESVSAK